MKYLFTISLLVLFNPSIFSQNNIKGTAWEVSYRNEPPSWIYLVGVGGNNYTSNRYIVMNKNGSILTYTTPQTWTLKGKKVVFKSTYMRGGHTLSGTINDEGNYISGIAMNSDGDVWDWWAKRIN
tara:strand:- start:255 stop:629 length:375 start_codon:yes stop_codon:yes gene_type:complete